MQFLHSIRSKIQNIGGDGGFTLVETLVAITMLLLALAGPMTLARQSLSVSNVTKDNVTAYYLAQDALEFLKNVRDTNTATQASWLTGITPCLTGCIVDTSETFGSVTTAVKANDGTCTPLRYDATTNKYGCNSSWTPSIYTRTVTMNQIVPGQESIITATISWNVNGRPYSFTATQSLYNIGEALTEATTDNDAPIISGGTPTGALISGTTQVVMGVSTSENGTCRYDTQPVAYDLMANLFSTTGQTNHSTVLTNLGPDGTTYTFYVRCRDQLGNPSTSSYVISFSISMPQTGGLVAYWPFDQNGNDLSGNNRHSTLTGQAAITTASKIGAGALQVDGNADYAAVGDVLDFTAAQSFSISLWAKPTATNGSATWRILAKRNSGTPPIAGYHIAMGTGQAVSTTLDDGTNTVNRGGGTMTVGEWTHIVLVVNRATQQAVVYTNNTPSVSSNISSVGNLSNSVPLNIGASSNPALDFIGSVDEVRMYNYALSAGEISTLFAQGQSSSGPITFDNAQSAVCETTGTSCSITNFAINQGAGNNRLVVVSVGTEVDTDATNVTINGVSGTEIQEHDYPGGNTLSQWYFLDSDLPASPGSYTVTATFPSITYRILTALAYRNVAQASPTDFHSGRCANCTNLPDSVSVGTANSLVIASTLANNPYNYVGNNGITKRVEIDSANAGGISLATGDKIVTATGATSAGHTSDASAPRMINAAVVFAPLGAGVGDVSDPSVVTNLAVDTPTASSLRVTWTAPGDDGTVGTASSYDLRRSTSPINEGNWASATTISGEPAPSVAGTAQNMTVNGLSSGTTYYFALKTTDDAGNVSSISNSPSGGTNAGGGAPTNGLVAYWSFDELVGGEVPDISGNGNNADVFNGAAITTSQKKYGAGAVNFDGVDDYMSVLHSADLNLGPGDWSITFWQRTPGTAEQRIIGKQSGGANKDFEIAHIGTRQLYLESKSTATNENAWTNSNAFAANTWNHVVITQDAPGMTPKFYVDGVEKTVGSDTITTVPPGNTNPIYIGARSGSSFFYTGQLDEMRLYNRVLSQAEVTAVFNDTGTSGATDTTAPSAIAGATVSNPTSNSLRLNWTSPGDDGSTGTASSYDIRYSTSAITSDSLFNSATQVTGEPAPSIAGTAQNMTISGLNASTQYFFAIKTSDEVPNTSTISNSPSGTTSAGGSGAVLVGHWPFDSSTQATDISGNSLNGTFVQQAAITTSLPKVGTGSVVTDGTADEVSLATNALLNITGPMSIAGWAKVTDTAVPRSLMSRNGGAGARGYSLRFNAGNTAEFHVSSDCTAEIAVDLIGTFTTGSWVHFVGTYEPGVALRIYLNGNLNNSLTTGVPASQCSNALGPVIGGRPNTTSESMLGNLDDVRLYTGVLNQSEITTLFNMGSGGGDTTAPAALAGPNVSNPTSNSMLVSWTSPGDDGSTGTAASYDIRYRAGSTFVEADWASATQVTGEPAPQVAGTAQSMTVSGLSANTTYTFRIKTSDEVPNVSTISTGGTPSGTTLAGNALIAHWTFDNTGADASGNGYAATLVGNAAYSTVNKIVGTHALTLDGSGDYMNVATDITQLNNATKFSISGWYRDTDPSVATGRYTFSKWSAANTENSAGANANEFYANVRTGVAEYGKWTGYGTTIPANTWYHAVMVYDGTQTGNANRLKLYVNDVQRTLAFTGTIQATAANLAGSLFRIGTQQTSTGYWNGQIDDLRVYNYPLTTGEISTLYAMGTPTDSTAPAAIVMGAVSNIASHSMRINWTAPGDDGSTGTATSYDIRYSTTTITAGNWASATQVTGEPTPAVAGTAQNMTITGLNSSQQYFFAIRASDEVPNLGALSNIPSGTTLAGAPTSGLVAYWPFDNLSGGLAPDQAGTYNGTLSGTAAISTSVKQIGAGSLSLGATSGYVNAGDITQLNSASRVTITMWIRDPNITATGRSPFGKHVTGGSGPTFLMIMGPSFHVDLSATAFGAWAYGSNVANNTWYHYAMVFDGTLTGNANRLKQYLNGAVVSTSYSGTIPATTNALGGVSFYIGANRAAGGYFTNGYIDDMRIYNRALTPTEIAGVYAETGN